MNVKSIVELKKAVEKVHKEIAAEVGKADGADAFMLNAAMLSAEAAVNELGNVIDELEAA